MAASVISARLDLMIRLIDTTTGAIVDEKNVLFMRNGLAVRPESRGPGVFIFINTGREDFLMRLEVFGYEPYEQEVLYGELDERLPVMNIFLMPSENMFKGEGLLSFSGTLPFLKKIEAVDLRKPVCIFNEYDAKKGIVKVFRTGAGKVEMEDIYYGLLSSDKQSYEKIEVIENVTPQSVRLKETLKGEFTSNSPVMRVIFGTVTKDGDYLLRVRDDGADIKYLVRYEVNDEVRFQTVDFRNMEALS